MPSFRRRGGSVTKGQAAIIAASRAMRDTTGNLPPMPSIFPDYPASIVRNAPDGVRELTLARWGMPSELHRKSENGTVHGNFVFVL
jgi:putative SOS response-associated peptidase YedK